MTSPVCVPSARLAQLAPFIRSCFIGKNFIPRTDIIQNYRVGGCQKLNLRLVLCRKDRQLCLSKIKCGHIGGAARRELGGNESARPVRRYARTAHPSPRIDACGRHCNISCTTAAGDGGGTRRARQRGQGIAYRSQYAIEDLKVPGRFGLWQHQKVRSGLGYEQRI